jgi:uncharacterized membrane protein SpoIIM required for sporulation
MMVQPMWRATQFKRSPDRSYLAIVAVVVLIFGGVESAATPIFIRSVTSGAM